MIPRRERTRNSPKHRSHAQALFEAKLLTTMLFSRFRFKMCLGEAEKIGYSLMLTMSIRNSRPGEVPTHALRVVPELR